MSLALYRRYRPETFAEVIGQEHVTQPLQQAIRNNRVHHAYLFSGPRGCGKTTSARILARALNCELGPTPDPCGECRSCQDLARSGPGSLDVVEIDAASHGGVEDARDLRERAFFAPAASRYKIYIVDEAHMVTTAGFNALLKVVEEPPEHVKFVFATTEPEKVIPTIRSRTHHYPFRLVPPGVLRDYLTTICEREGVTVEPGVLPLVVRSGAGSVRDSLSVLDQLIAGAGKQGVTYALAAALLGYTDGQLLDDVVDAFAARDGAVVFEVVDRVIEGGHDPRRFVQDLLERLRDLVILAVVPDAGGSGLIDAPEDQLERMRSQASRFGLAELSRAADLVNEGLTEMRGATAPRLHLELICARVLLPGAGDRPRDLNARLDRLERRLAIPEGPGLGSGVERFAAPGEPGRRPSADRASTASAERASTAGEPGGRPPAERASVAPPSAPPAATADVFGAEQASAGSDPAAAAVPEGGVAAAQPDLVAVRRAWPEVLDAVKNRRRFTWMTLVDGVQLVSLDAGTLALAFAEEGKRKNFLSSGSDEILRQALIDVLGVDWRIDAVLDPGRAAAVPATAASQGPKRTSSPPQSPAATSPPPSSAPSGSSAPSAPSAPTGPPVPSGSPAPGSTHDASAPRPPEPSPPLPSPPSPPLSSPPSPPPAPPPATPPLAASAAAPATPATRPPVGSESRPADAAPVITRREATAPRGTPGPPETAVPSSLADDLPSADDPDADDAGLSGQDLLIRELGASVIEEIEHD